MPAPDKPLFSPDTWHLIITPPAAGAWNMAVDEALLESMRAEDALPVLRLYAWEPPCLSLGYAQPVSDVDQEALRQRCICATVRREQPHTDEPTTL
jgi:lipoate-protein ligase A